MLTRRQVLETAGIAVAAVAASRIAAHGSQQATAASAASGEASSPFKLPPLPYAYDALEPYIDAQTMQFHHDKHHAAYVQNLNKAIGGDAGLAQRSVEDLVKNLPTLPEAIRAAVRNQGGGHLNHSLFWQMMSKNSGQPKDGLTAALQKHFGSQAAFLEKFNAAALKVFGSGWTWLSLTPAKELVIEPTANQDSPYTTGNFPLLCIDVWEHAYYLKYQNRRAEYVAAFAHVINWDFVSERFTQGLASM